MILPVFIIIYSHTLLRAAEVLPRANLLQRNYTDKPLTISLAAKQHLVIHRSEAISESISSFPEGSAICEITSPWTGYVSIASCPNDEDEAGKWIVTSIVVLESKKLAYTIDNRLRLRAYEIGEKTLTQKGNSRSLATDNKKNDSVDAKLVGSDQRNAVYIFSSEGAFYMAADSLSTGLKQLPQIQLNEIQTALAVKDFVYVASAQRGLLVFEILPDRSLKQLTFNSGVADCVDIAYDSKQQALYVLDRHAGVYVYSVDRRGYIQEYDYLNISQSYSNGFRIQASSGIVLVAFRQPTRNLVLQLQYTMDVKQLSLIRYFKFRSELKDILIQNQELVALGNGFLAILPLRIHPKLIRHEMNGLIQPVNLVAIKPYKNQFFGVARRYADIGFIQRSGSREIRCELDGNKRVTITYRANLTQCSKGSRQYYEYCSYSQTYHVEHANIVVGHSFGTFMQILMVVALVLAAICFLTAIGYRIYRGTRLKQIELAYQQSRNLIPLKSVRPLTGALRG